jgi:signal transduction histidine kinase
MHRITDEELIDELKGRFREKQTAMEDLLAVTKKLEDVNRKLQESEGLKSNFLSNIRNEMNNPLTSIMGLSRQIIAGNTLEPEAVYPIARMIHSEAFNLDFQLRNIFAAAELEAGEAELTTSTVDVDALVQNVIEQFRFRAFEKNIALRYAPISEDRERRALFSTDPEKLQIVVSNLVSNAIEYSLEGGEVGVRAWVEGGYLNLTVEDQGIGIDANERAAIFDRFKQLDAGSTKRHRGHGLGLSITRDLVELMLGNISVSSAPGGGSVFEVSAIPEADTNGDAGVFAINGNVFLFEDNAGQA